MEDVQEFGLYANLLGNYPEVEDKTKVNCYLVDSQTLRQLAGGIWGKLNGFHCRLVVGNLIPLGKKVSSLLYDPKFLLRWGLGA